MKTSLENAAEVYFIELFRTHASLSGKTLRHFDEDRPAESNCIVVQATEGNLLRANEPGKYGDDNVPPVLRDANGSAIDAHDVEVTATYRAPGTSTPKQNDLTAQAMTDAVTTARANQTTAEREFGYLCIRNTMSGARSNTKSLRKREKTFNLIAALK